MPRPPEAWPAAACTDRFCGGPIALLLTRPGPLVHHERLPGHQQPPRTPRGQPGRLGPESDGTPSTHVPAPQQRLCRQACRPLHLRGHRQRAEEEGAGECWSWGVGSRGVAVGVASDSGWAPHPSPLPIQPCGLLGSREDQGARPGPRPAGATSSLPASTRVCLNPHAAGWPAGRGQAPGGLGGAGGQAPGLTHLLRGLRQVGGGGGAPPSIQRGPDGGPAAPAAPSPPSPLPLNLVCTAPRP